MKSSLIAEFLGKKLNGPDIDIVHYSTLSNSQAHTVVFAKKFEEQYIRSLNLAGKELLAIVTPEYRDRLSCSYILSENPRLDYLKTIEEFFFTEDRQTGVHLTAVIEEGAVLGENVYIGANCYIGEKVTVGRNTRIYPNVVIMGETTIGEDCYIKSGTVIGQPGFGFEKDTNGIPVHFPHMGKVLIGDHVYIGAATTIDRATLEATVIGNHVKIDNLVHIAHNVVIEDASYIIAGTILGGGVHVGKDCWIAPNVTVKQQLRIGNGSLIGLGAVVVKEVNENTVVAGNPAKFLKNISC